MPLGTRHAIVLGAMLFATTPLAAQSAADPEAAQTLFQRVEYHISQSPSLGRYLANECLLTSVAAVVVALAIGGPVAPAAEAALGVVPGLSTFSIGALACGAGVAAGSAVAAFTTAWGERQAIQETAAAQIAWIWNGVAASQGGPGGAPGGDSEVAPGGSSGGWSIAGLWERAGEVTTAAVQTLAYAVPTVWSVREVPTPGAEKPAEYEIALVLRRP